MYVCIYYAQLSNKMIKSSIQKFIIYFLFSKF